MEKKGLLPNGWQAAKKKIKGRKNVCVSRILLGSMYVACLTQCSESTFGAGGKSYSRNGPAEYWHDVTPQPLVSPFKYYKSQLLEHVWELFFLYLSIASLYTLIPSVLAWLLSELFIEPWSPVKSHQGDLHMHIHYQVSSKSQITLAFYDGTWLISVLWLHAIPTQWYKSSVVACLQYKAIMM